MMSSISATPASSLAYQAKPLSGAVSLGNSGNANTSLQSTPNSPISYSPQVNNKTVTDSDVKTEQRVNETGSAQPSRANESANTQAAQSNPSNPSSPTTQSSQENAAAEAEIAQVISQLKARDTEVRAHEMAHLAAAGSYSTGGMSFSYQTGPDGRQYAVGGEVGIDTSPIAGDPEATMMKAQVIQRAALAPAEPSAQDIKVASMATQMMAQARVEIQAQNQAEMQGDAENPEEGSENGNGVGSRIDNLNGQDGNAISPVNESDNANNLIEQVSSAQAAQSGFNNQVGEGDNAENANQNLLNAIAARGAFDLRLGFQQGA